jgi:hypothetical protein
MSLGELWTKWKSNIVGSDRLGPDDVPPTGSSWDEIAQFALRYEGYAEMGGFEALGDLANSKSFSTLDEARACLFFEQRRWRHFGDHPDDETMIYIEKLLEFIRRAVSGSAVAVAG